MKKQLMCGFLAMVLCVLSLFTLSGCGGSGGGSDAVAATPPPPQDPGTPADRLKPPALFSADGEFLGYVIGAGNRTNHLLVYNDKINYRMMFGAGDGEIGYYWPGYWGNSYCIDDKCSEMYVYKNRMHDVIIGKSDYGNQWPFNSDFITSDGSQEVDYSQLTHTKVWKPKTEIKEVATCISPPGTPPPDCTQCMGDGGSGLDINGNPLYMKDGEPDRCYGMDEVPVMDADGRQVYGLVCVSLDDPPVSGQAVKPTSGKYHKVVPIDPQDLPFKHPFAVPFEIRVDY